MQTKCRAHVKGPSRPAPSPLSVLAMTTPVSANWFRDPTGRFEHRYWDGVQWTHHVATGGHQGVDPVVAGRPQSPAPRGNWKIQRQVRNAGVDVGQQVGGGTLFSEPVLVVNQKAKLVEVNAQYTVHDQHGRDVGAVREIGQSKLKRAALGRPSSHATKRLQILDHTGRVVLTLTRPRALARSSVAVRRHDGAQVGQIVQKTLGVFKSVQFELQANGRPVGLLVAEGGWDYRIEDTDGDEIARVVKSWSGLSRNMSTKRDKYVVQIHRPVDDPLRSLVVATALVIDTVFRQHR